MTLVNVNTDKMFTELKRQAKINKKLEFIILAGTVYIALKNVRIKRQEEKIEELTKEIKELKETKGE